MKTYTVKEVSELTNTNPETVRRWIRSGKLKATQSSRKKGNVISENMLLDFIKKSSRYSWIEPLIIGTTVLTATAIKQLFDLVFSHDSKIDSYSLKKLCKDRILEHNKSIEKKEKEIKHIQDEINAEQNSIKEINDIIHRLDNRI